MKALGNDFKHDRVIQRMITQEFKDNQTFRCPEEYDVFDADQEYSLKKNFTDGM